MNVYTVYVQQDKITGILLQYTRGYWVKCSHKLLYAFGWDLLKPENSDTIGCLLRLNGRHLLEWLSVHVCNMVVTLVTFQKCAMPRKSVEHVHACYCYGPNSKKGIGKDRYRTEREKSTAFKWHLEHVIQSLLWSVSGNWLFIKSLINMSRNHATASLVWRWEKEKKRQKLDITWNPTRFVFKACFIIPFFGNLSSKVRHIW